METQPKTTTCKGCGRDIVWGVTSTGAKVPLDPAASVYRYEVLGEGDAKGPKAIRAATLKEFPQTNHFYAVNHFNTCPVANRFSKSSGGHTAKDAPADPPAPPPVASNLQEGGGL